MSAIFGVFPFGPELNNGWCQYGQRAGGRRPGEVVPQPGELRGPFARRDIAVQRDDVPRAEVVAEVAKPPRSRVDAEVVEVGCAGVCIPVVVARRRPSAAPMTPPAPFVTARELFRRAVRIHMVTQCEHRPRHAGDELGSRDVAVGFASRDVAGCHDCGVGPGWRLRLHLDGSVDGRHFDRQVVLVDSGGGEAPGSRGRIRRALRRSPTRCGRRFRGRPPIR